MDVTKSFNILGINPGADETQAKHAYKAQVRRWHPDQFPEGSSTKAGAEEQLKQINIAYARVKAHLASVRPVPGVTPTPPRSSDRSNDRPSGKSEKRSWIDHLFDTLNTFAGNHDGQSNQTPAGETPIHRRKTFGQVLDEMAGGNMFSTPKRQPGRRAATRRSTAGYRRCRRRGSAVGAVGASGSPGPVKPVGRVRGIGRSR